MTEEEIKALENEIASLKTTITTLESTSKQEAMEKLKEIQFLDNELKAMREKKAGEEDPEELQQKYKVLKKKLKREKEIGEDKNKQINDL